ncbi:MAG: NUDIX hydrolase [Candidatus Gribaldobacteria bacterium]|nr:NUDIX hydrolase [Candidatus Gribaldobacteria bacterium]
MKIIKIEKVFSGKFLNFFRKVFITQSGQEGIWEYIEPSNPDKCGVVIFALTKNKEVILEKIFRVPQGDYIIELPAGGADTAIETIAQAAIRELLEETGFLAKEVIHILSAVSTPSLAKLKLAYFFASDVEFIGQQKCDDEEEIEVIKVPLGKLVDFVIEQSKVNKVEDNILSILPILQKKKLI